MRIAILTLPLALAACATDGDAIPQRGTGAVCDPAGLDRFAGQPATSALGAEMIATTGAGAFRWVPHDSAITMEFRPDRLTVFLDAANRVERANCG
ncbi:I78 family peptidase inhibitor [Sphingomicrobium nitratireducens]|uniref:I78 family peptidase inhibitor n=1 Tax=Sphingomicrobium nitratireducens TaxID=2964666 RepID=UPI00223FE1C6|nr:I78 family peptidase inhibitor [Sphingomicrobium nitratireducens]